MDSLNTLANSLPTSNLASAEKDLLNNFKAAALSITTLYRSSRHTSKRAYNAGYVAACQDLLRMIQHGVSDRGGGDEGSGGMSVGRVMDWVEARMEAIKAREEEEDEDEERERPRAAPPVIPTMAPPPAMRPPPPVVAEPRGSSPPAPTSAVAAGSSQARPSSPSSSPIIPRPIHPLPSTRTSKTRPNKEPTLPTSGSFTFPFSASNVNGTEALPRTSDGAVVDVSAGAKRRHAMMMLLDANGASSSVDVNPLPSASHGLPGARRRARSTRNLGAAPGQRDVATEAMDIEEDGGRDRKRVARR